jgi:hypothetical protein
MNFRVPQQRSQLFRNIVQFYLNRSADKRFIAFDSVSEPLSFTNIHQLVRIGPLKTRPEAKQEPAYQRRTENRTHNINR